MCPAVPQSLETLSTCPKSLSQHGLEQAINPDNLWKYLKSNYLGFDWERNLSCISYNKRIGDKVDITFFFIGENFCHLE